MERTPEQLRRRRLRLRIMQGAVARRMGVTQSALCRYERLQRTPDELTLKRWQRALATEERKLQRALA